MPDFDCDTLGLATLRTAASVGQSHSLIPAARSQAGEWHQHDVDQEQVNKLVRNVHTAVKRLRNQGRHINFVTSIFVRPLLSGTGEQNRQMNS
jgi:hypothetical protein